MELTDSEKSRRIAFANEFDGVLFYVFQMIVLEFLIGYDIDINGFLDEDQQVTVRNAFDDMYSEYVDTIETRLMDIIREQEEFVLDTDNEIPIFARERAENIIAITSRHISDGGNGINGNYYVSPNRAKILACEETNSACNLLVDIDAVKSGAQYKSWQTMEDDRVRHTHMIVNHTRIPITEKFTVGACKMRFPRDVECGNEEEIANCRCILIYG